MNGYAIGRSANDGTSFVLVPLADLLLIAGLLAVVEDRTAAEAAAVERVFATVMNEPPTREEQ